MYIVCYDISSARLFVDVVVVVAVVEIVVVAAVTVGFALAVAAGESGSGVSSFVVPESRLWRVDPWEDPTKFGGDRRRRLDRLLLPKRQPAFDYPISRLLRHPCWQKMMLGRRCGCW